MDKLYNRKVTKIYKKLDSLSSKGKDNILEYYKYIDEIIDKGDYSVFEQVINLYYGIDISLFQTVDDFKDKVWEEICLNTTLPILKRISKLYEENGIYQQSTYIYKKENYDINDDGSVIPIGQIIESEKVSDNFDYLVKNKMYARLIGERIPFLRAINNQDEFIDIDNYDFNLNPQQNQFNQYKIAVDYLING
jgi:hypothetical protein